MLRLTAYRLDAKAIALAVATFPVALALWPIVSYDYAQRGRGNLPDRWHWADRRLLKLGWYVSS
jgi:hypothetical protein